MRAAPPERRQFRFVVLAAAAVASIAVPVVLVRQYGGSTATTDCASADGAALKALALLAQKNADGLRGLLHNSIDADAIEALERAGARPMGVSQLADAHSPARTSSAAQAAVATPPLVADRTMAAARTEPSEKSSVWLRFALVSVARQRDVDYLLRALYAIFEQIPPHSRHPLARATDVVVVNNNEPASAHHVFHEAARRFAGRAQFLTKQQLNPPLDCPSRGLARRGTARTPPPKPSVQRQTCDLVAAFGALTTVQPAAEHVMLLEDDWLLCPHGLLAVYHAMDKSYAYDPHWIALRVSYGFNGGGITLNPTSL